MHKPKEWCLGYWYTGYDEAAIQKDKKKQAQYFGFCGLWNWCFSYFSLFIPIDVYVSLHIHIFIGSRELQEKPNHEQCSLKQVQENLFPNKAACIKVGQKLIQHVKQVFNATLINQFSYNYIQIPCVNMLDKWLWNRELI